MSLIEASTEKLQILRDRYLKEWPKYIISYYTIDNYINWLINNEDLKDVRFLTVDQNWQESGTFLIIVRIFKNLNLNLINYRKIFLGSHSFVF